ncbi:MAG: c-type cytochrome [Planctomycetaceae bacterium]|nr:c-type cytochrome [Planctomycetaceae bacterium]
MTVTGCSRGGPGFDAQFVPSEVTTSLMPEAQNGLEDHVGVNDIVNERFGTPQQLKAWTKLPLEFGGTTGTIAESPDGSVAVKVLKLTFDHDVKSFDAATDDEQVSLQIVSGEAATEVASILRYSAETGVADLSGALEKIPAAGDMIVLAGGDVLKHGRVLYMRHCSHCHGTSGDGAGPTAEYLYPRPRDYRNGLFKFTSTKSLMRPSRDDIARILKNGIPGTYMPSFVPMLEADELHDTVEYVRFLSMRGEFERKIAGEFSAEYSQAAYDERRERGESRQEITDALKAFYVEDLPDYLNDDADALTDGWTAAEEEDSVIVPSVPRVTNDVESRRRGRELFVGATLNCVNCHGIGGRGDGPQTRDFELVDGRPRPHAGLHDEWGQLVKPRDLTSGIYRGGRRPVDIFRRIYSGINGAKMPAFGGKITDEQMWDVVNYVLSIPFEPEPGKGVIAAPAAETASL